MLELVKLALLAVTERFHHRIKVDSACVLQGRALQVCELAGEQQARRAGFFQVEGEEGDSGVSGGYWK